jgi:cytochrome P450
MSTPPGQRRAVPAHEVGAPRIGREGRVWRIGSLEIGRQILRTRGATAQAGFTAEQIPRGVLRRHPILISDGALHDEQRRSLARFFAPGTIQARYGELMESRADAVIAAAEESGRCRLDEAALEYAVAVTAQVVGLTASPVPAMARRLEAFFRQPPFDLTRPRLGRTRRQLIQAAHRGLSPLLRFHLLDVLPALRAHRRRPQDDVLGSLLAQGASRADILVECVTYGTAGMVTTRELITMACWHLLEDDPLRARYLIAEQEERIAILEEILRLEPVVGHLHRRVREPITVEDEGRVHSLEPGDLVDIDVRTANTDPAAMGAAPLSLCPGRSRPRGVPATGLSFGDGAHRCPGGSLALLETDVLLTRLLARGPRLLTAPSLGWDDLVAGYRLRGMELGFDAERSPRR